MAPFELAVRVGASWPAEQAGPGRLAALTGAIAPYVDAFYLRGATDDAGPEPFVLLGALAAGHGGLLLGELASSPTRRLPSLLAKLVSSLDVLSAGRARCVLGRSPVDAPRSLAALQESLEIVRAMLRVPAPYLVGPHLEIAGAWNEPSRGAERPVPLGLFVDVAAWDETSVEGGVAAEVLLDLSARFCEWCYVELTGRRDPTEVAAAATVRLAHAGRLVGDVGLVAVVGLAEARPVASLAAKLAETGYAGLVLDIGDDHDAGIEVDSLADELASARQAAPARS